MKLSNYFEKENILNDGYFDDLAYSNATGKNIMSFCDNISYLKIALFLFYLTVNSGLLNLKLVAYLIVQITTTALVGSITTGFITLLTAIIRRTFTITASLFFLRVNILSFRFKVIS